MNIHGITNTNFGAKIQFENRTAENTPLPKYAGQICRKTCINAKRIIMIPLFFSAVLSKIIKVRKSIKLPS